jgi:hypothetical protein
MPGDVLVGVELEASHGGSRELAALVHRWGGRVQHDGSVTDGFEIAAPPASGDKFVAMIEEITAASKAAHGEITQKCGLHVHIDCRDLSPYQLLLFTGLWCCFEHQFFAMMPPSRRGTNQLTSTWYCKPLSPRWRAMQALATGAESTPQLLGFLIGKRFRPYDYSDAPRYMAWNLAALAKYSTIECRLHSGTLMANKIIPWACILASLKRKVQQSSKAELIQWFNASRGSLRNALMDIVFSEEARCYIEERQRTFASHNTPESMLAILNPLAEYKHCLRNLA